MKVKFSRQSIDDLISIKLYIRQFHPVRAEHFIAELSRQCRLIGDFPHAHALDPNEDVRIRVFGRYRIVYAIENSHVVILRVRHASRDSDPT